jgi:hypothetical protein
MIKLHVGNELMRKISMIYVCVQLRGVNQQTSSVPRGGTVQPGELISRPAQCQGAAEKLRGLIIRPAQCSGAAKCS